MVKVDKVEGDEYWKFRPSLRCPICGLEKHPVWKAHVFKSHVFASNNASNIVQVLPLAVQPKTITKSTHRAGSKQRWSRDSYNAYQREYMKVWREKRRAKG